jgi:hypothetical protein
MTEKIEWKDETSYSRGENPRVPKTFVARCGPLKLVVTCGHIHSPGRWVAHCHPIFDTKTIDATSREEAQAEVVRLAREWLSAAAAALN